MKSSEVQGLEYELADLRDQYTEHSLRGQLQARDARVAQLEAALQDMKSEVDDCVDALTDEVLQPMNEGDMNPVKMAVCLAQLTQAVEAIEAKVLTPSTGA